MSEEEGKGGEGDDVDQPPSMSSSSHNNVILSLRDNYYKDTLWRRFKKLGKVRDKDGEARTGDELYSLFKVKMGETGMFCKYEGNRVVVVNDDKAFKSEYTSTKRTNGIMNVVCVCVCIGFTLPSSDP